MDQRVNERLKIFDKILTRTDKQHIELEGVNHWTWELPNYWNDYNPNTDPGKKNLLDFFKFFASPSGEHSEQPILVSKLKPNLSCSFPNGSNQHWWDVLKAKIHMNASPI